MFAKKEIQPLIFDEFPYKKYMVKCAQPPQLKYLCFDQYEFRIYKGEGTVQLVAYYPYAFSVISPKLTYSENGAIINNNGDISANLQIIFSLDSIPALVHLELRDESNKSIGEMNLVDIKQESEDDKYLLIDSQTQLLEGLNQNKQKTGHLYNKYLDSGDFFWPAPGRSYLFSSHPFINAQYTPLYY